MIVIRVTLHCMLLYFIFLLLFHLPCLVLFFITALHPPLVVLIFYLSCEAVKNVFGPKTQTKVLDHFCISPSSGLNFDVVESTGKYKEVDPELRFERFPRSRMKK